MINKMDRRTPREKIVDVYLKELLIESGEKNPIRRKAFEDDVNYALQVIEPFNERYNEALKYDIYAVEPNFSKAIAALQNAVDTLDKFGITVTLPSVIEDPNLIEAECAMALIDILRSLNAFFARAAEYFVTDVLLDLFERTVASNKRQHPQITEFIRRYAHDEISESVLDKIALEDDYLEEYLKTL